MTSRVVPAEAFPPGEEPEVGRQVSLRASRCAACGRTEFPALRLCPACGERADEVTLPPEGTLVGFTSVLHPPPGSLVEAPYHVGVAELGGAIRILGLLDGPPDELAVGMPIETVAASPAADVVTYAFRIC